MAMGDAAVAKARTWQLMIAPWSEAQRAALRRFGNDESSVLLFALRTDGGKLEVFVTCKAPRRAAWLSTHVIEGEWRPAASPKTKGERCNLLAQYQECCDRSNQGQRANVLASAASPARPPKDREGLQAARPPEDREDLDLGLPPLTAVPDVPAPAAATFSLPSLPPPTLPLPSRPHHMYLPAQRTAAERDAAERAAKRARRGEREWRMCEEGERALQDEAARSSLAWRRISNPSSDDDDDLPSALRAHPGDTSSDVYERWCDYGPEFVRSRPYRPRMPPKPPPLDVARQPNLPPDLLALALNSLAGKYYVGERNAAGQCDGRGKYVFAEGAVFEGDFKAGKPEGRIIYRSADGDVYEGDFKAGEKDGRGIYWFASGKVYEGEFKAGKPEGRGIYWFASGDVHKGEFKAGKPEGRGIYWSADGDVYEGEFKADKRDHDETNRSLNRSLGASRSANSSAAHSIAASPFHAIQSRSIWDGRVLGRGL